MRVAIVYVVLLVAASTQGAVLSRSSRVPTTCEEAFEFCAFGFEGKFDLSVFAPGTPGQSFTPTIVFKEELGPDMTPTGTATATASPFAGFVDDIVGHVDSTGEPFVLVDGGFIPISEWTCSMQPFSPSFFKSASNPNNEFGLPTSGVSHETPQSNQLECLKDVCTVLPFIDWQVFRADGVTDNVVSTPEEYFENCVAFVLTT